MPVLRRPIYQSSVGADEDYWFLVLDNDSNRLFVEHEQKRGDMRGRGYGLTVDELDLAVFLREQGPAQHELVRLLSELFEEQTVAA